MALAAFEFDGEVVHGLDLVERVRAMPTMSD